MNNTIFAGIRSTHISWFEKEDPESYNIMAANCEEDYKENLEVKVPCLSSFGDLEKLVARMDLKFTKNTNEFLLLAIMKTLGPALSQKLIQNSKYWLRLTLVLLMCVYNLFC